MSAEQHGSVACKAAEPEHASEKDCTPSSDVWSEFLAKIKELCLERNFGTFSKSEFDLLVFHYYLLEKQANASGKYVSDYEIGCDLGLTIQRVRSLRERDALKWRSQVDWKNSLLDSLELAHCDGNNVKIPVPDVNVIKEIRNYLESAGLFDDYQLNPKIFQCNLELFVAICLKLKSNRDDNLFGEMLDKLRKSKDGTIARAVKEQEHPFITNFRTAAIKILQDYIARFPFIGNATGELVAKYLEKLR